LQSDADPDLFATQLGVSKLRANQFQEMSIPGQLAAVVKRIPDLVAWALSPMPAPWEQDTPSSSGRTAVAAVPGVAALYPILQAADDNLLLIRSSKDFLILFFSLSPLLIALLMACLGRRFSRIQILRMCGWLYRNYALNILLLILWGMALKQKPQAGLDAKWYSDFYFAIYSCAVGLLTLNVIALIQANQGRTVAVISVVVYLAFLSFVLFVCPLVTPDLDHGLWWDPNLSG
jgi:hypothetical protein